MKWVATMTVIPWLARFWMMLKKVWRPVGLTPLAVLVLVVEGGRTCWMEVGGAGTGPAYFPEPAPAAVAQNPAGA